MCVRAPFAILLSVTATLLLLATCSTHRVGTGTPHLRLSVSQHVGEIPFEVTFNGYLDGGSDADPRFYCLDAEWDFLGQKVLDSVDCDPLEDGNVRIRRAYSTLYTFDKVGFYTVRLTLLQDGEVRATTTERVNARQSGFGLGGGAQSPMSTTTTIP